MVKWGIFVWLFSSRYPTWKGFASQPNPSYVRLGQLAIILMFQIRSKCRSDDTGLGECRGILKDAGRMQYAERTQGSTAVHFWEYQQRQMRIQNRAKCRRSKPGQLTGIL